MTDSPDLLLWHMQTLDVLLGLEWTNDTACRDALADHSRPARVGHVEWVALSASEVSHQEV